MRAVKKLAISCCGGENALEAACLFVIVAHFFAHIHIDLFDFQSMEFSSRL